MQAFVEVSVKYRNCCILSTVEIVCAVKTEEKSRSAHIDSYLERKDLSVVREER